MSWCRSRRALQIAAAALLVALFTFGPAPAANAHPILVGSTPSDGQTLPKAPDRLRLEFSEQVVLTSVRLELRPASGAVRPLTARAAAAEDTKVSAPLPPLGQDIYEVRWAATSGADGHRLKGSVVFGVQRAVAAQAPGRRDGPRAWDVMIATGRTLGTAGAVGGFLAAAVLVPLAARRRPAGLWERARRRALVLAAGAAGIGAISVVAAGIGSGMWPVAGTGHALRLTEQMVLLLTVSAGALVLLRRAAVPEVAFLGAAVLSTVVGALDGHAVPAASAGAVLAVVVHAVAANVWTGGIIGVAVVACPLLADPARRPAGRTVLAVFGPPAVIAVIALGVTGPLLAGRQVATVDAGLRTPYGAVLGVKLALLACAAVAAVWSAAGSVARRGGRRRLIAETLLLGGAAAAAAVLTVTPPARGPGLDPVTAAPPLQRSARSADLVVAVAVRPGTPGRNLATIDVLDTRRPAPGPVTDVSLGISGAPVTTAPVSATRWEAVVDLPATARVPVWIGVRRADAPDTSTEIVWTPRGRPPGTALVDRPLAPLTRSLALAVTVAAAAAALTALAGLAGRRRRPAAPLTVPPDDAAR